jgi:hypothetical protein
MTFKLECLNGHWILSRAGNPDSAFVVRQDSEDQMNLLVFLGLAERGFPNRLKVVLREGEFEL